MHVNIMTQSDKPEVIQPFLWPELSLQIINRAELSSSDRPRCLAEVFLCKCSIPVVGYPHKLQQTCRPKQWNWLHVMQLTWSQFHCFGATVSKWRHLLFSTEIFRKRKWSRRGRAPLGSDHQRAAIRWPACRGWHQGSKHPLLGHHTSSPGKALGQHMAGSRRTCPAYSP